MTRTVGNILEDMDKEHIVRGEAINLGKLVGHYKLMSRMDRNSADFWRERARVAIAEFRAS